MHNNYYFFYHLAQNLESQYTGFKLRTAYTQQKNECIFAFVSGNRELYIIAHLDPGFTCLAFPEKQQRARKNSTNLFEEAYHNKINRVRVSPFDRYLLFYLENQWTLVFKLFGIKSNIILYSGQDPHSIFLSRYTEDLEPALDQLGKPEMEPPSQPPDSQEKANAYFRTFGPRIWNHARDQEIDSLPPHSRWKALLSLHKQLLHATHYYICEDQKGYFLSLLPMAQINYTYPNAIETITRFFFMKKKQLALQQRKKQILGQVEKQIKQATSYISKSEKQLQKLEGKNEYQRWADLIMAYMHQIKPSATSVELPAFEGDRLVRIPLKPGKTPQKIAEQYYRKAKNKAKELDVLISNIRKKKQALKQLLQKKNELEQINSLDELKMVDAPDTKANKLPDKPYHEILVEGFRIWVGKNAKANDELTLKYGYKDDYWLHARDVAGSHVLIKAKPGQNPSPRVLERAASLAAYFSKRKNEALCPVLVTRKKYIRKPKGLPPGKVLIDKEDETLLVPPQSL